MFILLFIKSFLLVLSHLGITTQNKNCCITSWSIQTICKMWTDVCFKGPGSMF